MKLKRLISIFFLLIFFQEVNCQTHMFIGPAADIATVGNNYYSWSIGEVVVFNEQPSAGATISLAQAMQSYTKPPLEECFKVNINAVTEQLCDGQNSFSTLLSYTVSQSKVITYDTIQWYFAEKASADIKDYAKVVGANSTDISKTYRPYFPGAYRVCLTNNIVNCKVCSDPVTVKLSSSSFTLPFIVQDAQPAKTLVVSYDKQSSNPIIQWYAYIPVLKKYLLVAGGTKPDLKVRYDGDYMAIVSYPNGCKLTATTTVSGYNKPLYRAGDVLMDGNNIYIPEETAYMHSSLNIYPNPAVNSFTVRFESSFDFVTKAELYSNTGLLVKEIKFTEGDYWSRTAQVNVEDLSAGVYFLKVNEGGRQVVQKLVLQK